MRRALLLIWLVLVGAQVTLGITWLAQNLGEVPAYGDTSEYLHLARKLEVDAYRGVAYPALIAAVDRLVGGAGREIGFYVQILQVLASVACLAYFLRVLVVRPGATNDRAWFTRPSAILLPLLALDPLIAHFDIAIMTDGLALSASLAFCAALTAFGLGKSRRALSGSMLLLAFLLTAGLRVEKVLVLTSATLATSCCWLLMQRGLAREARWFSAARALQCVGLVLAGGLALFGIQRSTLHEGKRWPIYESVLQQRIVFPNLSAVYDELPQDVRARVSRAEARRHDRDILTAKGVIEEATGGTGPRSHRDQRSAAGSSARPSVDSLRRSMLEEMSSVVLKERWALVVADVLLDAAENVAASFSFYARMVLVARQGTDALRTDGSAWTYKHLAQTHPRTSLLYVCSSALLFFFSLALAAAALLRRRRSAAPRIERRVLAAWVPVAAFALANAFAFALVADLVYVRYALFSHAATLVVVYLGAHAWFTTAVPRRPADQGSRGQSTGCTA